jgi:hypothetical protein
MASTKMKRALTISHLTLMIAVFFGGLIGWGGATYASEPPADGQPASVSIRVYLTEEALPVDDPNSSVWDSVASSEFNLAPQVHWPERLQEATVKSFKVRGLHNEKELAAAVELMVGDKKAHFAHGQEMLRVEGGPVNIWYWKKEYGKAIDMSAQGLDLEGPNKLRPQEEKFQNVKATGVWNDGTWRVVFSRDLQTEDEQDAQIEPGNWTNVAFAFWDGQLVDGVVKEKGSQKAVSSWWYMRAEPPPDNSIFGYVVMGLLIAAAFEFFLVRKIRKGQSS